MKNNFIWIVLGIVVLVIVATKLPLLPQFAILTTTTCADGITNYYSLDGNFLDSKGNLDLINHGTIFVNGKINQGIQFDGTNYVSFPSIPSNLTAGFWMNNYTSGGWNYVLTGSNALTSQFMLGLNGSIDEIVIGNNFSDLSNIQACYQTTVYENVTCQEYAVSQQPDKLIGCLNFSGSYFPNCSYNWVNQTTYKIENNLCKKNYLCQPSCIPSSGCYSSNQNCIENLNYECYILSNNECIKKTDYSSCVLNTTYQNVSNCQANVIQSTSTTETTSTEEKPLISNLSKELFNLFGISINAIHLIIALLIIVALLYFLGAFGKK